MSALTKEKDPAPSDDAVAEGNDTTKPEELEQFADQSAIVEKMNAVFEGVFKAVKGDLEARAFAVPVDEFSDDEQAMFMKHCGLPEGDFAKYADLFGEVRAKFINSKAPAAPANDATKSKPKKSAKKGDGGSAGSTAKNTPKKAPEIVKIKPVAAEASKHELPEKRERAKALPRPKKFFFESAEQTSRMPHQVDPSRSASYVPVMPNLDLLERTGNPYPAKADASVVCADSWKGNVAVAHATYAVFAEKGEVKSSDKETVALILAAAGASDDNRSRGAIRDSLRDCALYGLCDQYRQGRARIFKKVA